MTRQRLWLAVCGLTIASNVAAEVCLQGPAGELLRVNYSLVGSGSYALSGSLRESSGLISSVTGSLSDTATGLVGTMIHSGSEEGNYWTEISHLEWTRDESVVNFKSIGNEAITTIPYHGEHTLSIIPCS